MDWKFLKSYLLNIKKSQIHNSFPFPIESDKDSFSFWRQDLSYLDSKYHLENAFEIPYEISFKDEFHVHFSEINTYIKQAILKDKILKNLYNILDNLHKECKEEDFQIFSETARKNAKQILSFIYKEFPDYNYYIYPTEDREIAIDCNPQEGRGILVLCDSDDGVACFVTWDGKNRRFRYDSIGDFSYKLLGETFEELDIKKKYSLTSPSSRDSFSILTPEEEKLNYNFPKNEICSYA